MRQDEKFLFCLTEKVSFIQAWIKFVLYAFRYLKTKALSTLTFNLEVLS